MLFRSIGVKRGQEPIQTVENNNGPGIAYMSIVVDGRAAHIHRNPLGVVGNKRFFGPSERVVELQLIHAYRTMSHGDLSLN